MTLALVSIVVRLGVLAVGQAGHMKDRAADQRLRTFVLPADRGEILDANGRRLALSMPATDVYADPRYVDDPWDTATQLAPILDQHVGALVEELSPAPDPVRCCELLDRWRWPTAERDRIAHLIRHHMFWYETHWTGSAVRRFIRKVGIEYIPALFALRRADNIGSGARSPRMHALEALWLRVQEEITAANAFSLRDLKIDGNDIMRELGIPSGPKVGQILDALFERVTDEPALNTREKLIEIAKAIAKAMES